eukprot:Polyplicarium_translucidae@DN1222_c0_g1_i1.p1
MSYIIVVNPDILRAAGMAESKTATATALSGLLATAFMAVYANLPFGLAPGMGLNALFAYELVQKNAFTVPEALGCCFCAGFAFFLLAITGWSHRLVGALPLAMKKATVVGIGMFQALAGLYALHVVRQGTYSVLELNDTWGSMQYVGVATLALIALLVVIGVPGSILIGIVCSTALSMAIGAASLPSGIFRGPDFDIGHIDFRVVGTWRGALLSLVTFFVLFIDTGGVIVAMAAQGDSLTDSRGDVIKANRAYVTCGLGVMMTSLFGTSPIVIFLESAAAINQGARTGLTALVAAVGLGLSLFFSPLVAAIPRSATAPVLVLVGSFMMGAVMAIPWDSIEQALPAFVTIIMVAFSCSIYDGLVAGFLFYAVLNFPALVAKITGWRWLRDRIAGDVGSPSITEKRSLFERELERRRVHAPSVMSEPLLGTPTHRRTTTGWI